MSLFFALLDVFVVHVYSMQCGEPNHDTSSAFTCVYLMHRMFEMNIMCSCRIFYHSVSRQIWNMHI